MPPTPLQTLLQDIREKKTCDLRQGKHVSNAFLSIPPHRVGILHLAMVQRFLLTDPTGCGKTPQALVAYSYLKEKDPTLRLVVVTLASAIFQWQGAVAKFLTGISVAVPGYSSRRTKTDPSSRRWQWALDQPDVMITTYHTLARDVEAILPSLDNFVLVLDEVQTVGNVYQTSLFPAVQKVSLKARYAWGLSATPMMKRLENLFAVFEALWPGFLGGSLAAFKETYVNEIKIRPKSGGSFWKTIGHKNLPQLKAQISPFRLGRPAVEIDQYLPPVVLKQVTLDLPPKQRALYDQLAKHKRFPQGESPFIEDPLISAGVKSARTLQKQPSIQHPDERLVEGRKLSRGAANVYRQMVLSAPAVLGFPEVPSAKWDELDRFLTEECGNGEKVIVYSKFERVVTWLCEQLQAAGIRAARITGKESTKVREASRVRFQTSDELQVMVIDDAGGQALDLQAAGIVVFYDLPWVWGTFIQLLGRARRVGSTHPKVLAVLLLANNSIDADIIRVLNETESIAAELESIDHKILSPTTTSTSTTTPSLTTESDSMDPSPDLDLDLRDLVGKGSKYSSPPSSPEPDEIADMEELRLPSQLTESKPAESESDVKSKKKRR